MNLLIEFDKSGAEWVCVAYLADDEKMIDVVERGVSPHVITGSLIAGCSEKDVELDNKVVGHNTDPLVIRNLRQENLSYLEETCTFLPRTMSIRQAGKKSNHGLNYDMGYVRFALENEMPLAESKQIVQLYRTVAYPGIPDWHRRLKEQLGQNRTLVNYFNRKREFGGPWNTELFQQSYAYLPQSTVGDICYNAMRGWKRDTLGMDLLSNIHDSLLLNLNVYSLADFPFDNVYEFATSEKYMGPMLSYSGHDFYIGTDIKIGMNWGEDAMVEVHFDSLDSLKEGITRNWSKISGEAA